MRTTITFLTLIVIVVVAGTTGCVSNEVQSAEISGNIGVSQDLQMKIKLIFKKFPGL